VVDVGVKSFIGQEFSDGALSALSSRNHVSTRSGCSIEAGRWLGAGLYICLVFDQFAERAVAALMSAIIELTDPLAVEAVSRAN